MFEYAVIRMSRWEGGTDTLPAEHPRRCRYYILAANKNAAEEIIESRWPECNGVRDSYQFVGEPREVKSKFGGKSNAK
jgi:hypothetical protein